MLNAKQMRAATSSMSGIWDQFPGGKQVRTAAGGGPYAIVATTSAAAHHQGGPAPAVLACAKAFAPTTFPYWSSAGLSLTPGDGARLACDGTVWVVPGFVAALLRWSSGEGFNVIDAQSLYGLPTPPAERDMAAWLATRLTTYRNKGPGLVLPVTADVAADVTAAVAALGWVCAKELVTNLPTDNLHTPEAVSAILVALAAAPSAARS